MVGTHTPMGRKPGIIWRREGGLSGSTNSNIASPQVTVAGCTLYIHKYDERRQLCKTSDDIQTSVPLACSLAVLWYRFFSIFLFPVDSTTP